MSQDNFTNDEWYTPPDLMVKVRKILGNDFLDPASSVIAAPHIKASRYFTRVDNGLNQQWKGKVWLNPPPPIQQAFMLGIYRKINKTLSVR